MSTEYRIQLLTTGGTIAGQVASDKQDEAMVRRANEFAELIGPTISYLQLKHEIGITVEPLELCDVDSSNIVPEHWVQIGKQIVDSYDDFDAFVVTHGTNTLGYTCAALAFALENPAKPIILTGSQVSAGLPGSDGLTNLQNALRVAVGRRVRGKTEVQGVLAVFGSYIITGTRVKKDTEFDYDAFKSFSIGAVGRIGRIINWNETNLAQHVSHLSTARNPEAYKAKDLQSSISFDNRIASITEFPGMSSSIFETLVEQEDVQGFVFRAFGAGDPSERHLDAFRFLKQKRIPIVVTTQAPNGNSNFQVNEPGRRLKDEDLAIPAYDMSIESITAKLMWLLAKKAAKEITYEQLCAEMVVNIRGEVNVMWEVG